jgi:hypothetical protein
LADDGDEQNPCGLTHQTNVGSWGCEIEELFR